MIASETNILGLNASKSLIGSFEKFLSIVRQILALWLL